MIAETRLSEIVALWKEDKKQYVKRSTFAAYTLLIENHILPVFGETTLVEEQDVQTFVFRKLNEGLSHKTIKDILIVLKMILRFGVKNQMMEYRQIDIKFPPERDNHSIDILSRSHQKQIMEYIQSHFTFKNLGIYICLSAGMRIGEICALTWDDLDVENGIIHVQKTIQRIYIVGESRKHTEVILDTPKTKNSIREIPMTKDLLKMLRPIKKIVNGCFYVLTNEQTPTEPRYNNCTITQSRICSVFDLLYEQYAKARQAFLKKHLPISRFDSENLTFGLLERILAEDAHFCHLGIICHQPLWQLIRDWSLLDDDERRYVSNRATHLDFLIYNRVSKQPVLAIETDGYKFHKQGTRQAERDEKKDRILAQYGLPLLRLSTIGTDEKAKIRARLHEILI
ncbi:DUF2726 domain-containing protein [uncultured Alistipes sp.]|uniref:DUF2726 domain-containing protein n=1 Tax=uncultured Alistipes sp. TaxID=538949 RepID=UPI00266FAD87|nr:DUF2726 domain-containing protein [uncultured Alistipes sp.]